MPEAIRLADTSGSAERVGYDLFLLLRPLLVKADINEQLALFAQCVRTARTATPPGQG